MTHKLQRVDLKTQVKNEVIKYIKCMDLETSNKLPREEQLCEMMGVSRITLRAVLNELATDGVIFRKQGKGTFVNVESMDIKVNFNPVMHFCDMIRKSGFTPSTKLAESYVEEVSPEIAQELGLEAGTAVSVCKKLFFADDRLCACCIDYVDLTHIPIESLEDMEVYTDSIFHFLYQKAGIKIMWDRVQIDVVAAREVLELNELIEQGECMDKPYLLLKGVNYDSEDRPMIYALEYIDTEIIQFNQIRRRNIDYI
ncbi:MAG: GntR family transcriptional regulator [Cellulosilyticaceae bacterium]